jgi:hypothetical protein
MTTHVYDRDLKEAFDLFKDSPDIQQFLYKFATYCHLIDDVIDVKEIRDNPQSILKVTHLALDIYSSQFFRDNVSLLHPIILMIHNTYADSVEWEHSEIKWKATQADTLRCFGNEIILVLIERVFGYDKMREFSTKIREGSYKRHHTEDGKQI